jgi:hypothetical protein
VLAIKIKALALAIGAIVAANEWAFIGIEAKPCHPIVDDFLECGIVTLYIGVLDAQYESATMMAGEQIIEERRARRADVKKPGGRGRHAHANRRIGNGHQRQFNGTAACTQKTVAEITMGIQRECQAFVSVSVWLYTSRGPSCTFAKSA